ncbi:peroxynitrite isomerase THAP4-like [Hydra vulgaris]|uniref:peroxynitrite isomerase THAP4-like n=1 Tax=Hydra vulgaris TaxID=6087 RepID=UPI000640C0EF|nr:peroxynitrite isomerase THAP4-like [Hydra vulgaris]
MPRKCCVTSCSSNYDKNNEKYVSVYRLPKDKDNRLRWIAAIPRDNILDSKYTVVCTKHWPENVDLIMSNGKKRPNVPPTKFHNVNLSQISTAPAKGRKTTRTSFSERNIQEDEMSSFNDADNLEFSDIMI